MNAKVKELWLIVECPNCLRPQVMNIFVKDNAAINVHRTRYLQCLCGTNSFVELEDLDTDLDRPMDKKELVNMG
jgi:hypothetical protein